MGTLVRGLRRRCNLFPLVGGRECFTYRMAHLVSEKPPVDLDLRCDVISSGANMQERDISACKEGISL